MSHTERRLASADTAALDSEVVPLPLAPITPILRVANEIRRDNPRVAYLCYFHALKKISLIHLTSRELGVRQFKTQLQQRVEKEDVETKSRLARNDAEEILLFYQTFYAKNIREGEHTKYPEEMAKVCQIATILYEVLKAVVPPDQIDLQIQRIADDVKKKRDQYPHYNILPLYAPGVKPAIMELPEIQAAIQALRNVNYLPMPSKLAGDEENTQMMDRPTINDIFDWLSSIFGFQKGSIANQREHLILLLANINTRKNTNETRRNPEDYIRLSSSTVDRLEDKIFANYICWCKCLNCKPSTERFAGGYDKMQMKLVYIALFLLIWGEASNVRFMPECLCYIFHHMAKEIYVITYNNVHPVSGEAFESEVRDGGYFLRNIITPLYDVLDKEAKRSRGGRESNSKWRNYDDLNEFFWTDKCFSLGWPMNPKSNFFRHYTAQRSPANKRNQATADRSEPKTNFVELRTFWHLYRNFERMWIFLALAFQAMVIVAWNSRTPSRPLSSLFDARVFTSVLSIVVTYAFLNLLRATLDIALILNAWKSLKATQMVRHVLKFAVAAFWALVMAFEYRGFAKSKTGLTSFFDTNRSLYGLAVIVYLMPNLLDSILFVLPNLKRAMDNSKLWIITLLLWWTQEPQIYVGRDMCENWFSQLKYTLFWVTLLLSKLAFSYYVEVLPLVGPTKEIMEMSVDDYQWHKLFPTVTQNTSVVVAIWAPIVLVYFMDMQLWYVIYSTLLGVIHGAFNHLGEVRTLEILKSRSDTLPMAFTRNLIPRSTTNANENSDRETFERSIVIFYKVWNEFIKSMRMEDLLSNRDRDLLLAPLDSSGDFSVFQWPPYLLASKISVAIDLAISFRGRELFKRIKFDDYMYSAVVEFYEGLRDVLLSLLNDESDKLIVKRIFNEIEESIMTSTFCNKFYMYGLFPLSERLEKLFKLLLCDEDEEYEVFKPQVINVLQDAMEIIIRDIMIDGREILELDDHRYNARGYNKLEQRFENINHWVLQDKSWKKKVARLYMLLTVRESAKIVPQNLEARRRITFFADSLFMNMPIAPRVRDMLSFSILTPYYKEDVLYTDEELRNKNEDGISTLFYLQKIYTDEWMNFLERISDRTMYSYDERTELTQQWVSYRGQTLYRTVRGMMYYRQALELQCLLELVEHTALRSDSTPEKAVHNAAQALVDLKFTYVVSCQNYDALKKSDDPRDKNCYVNILKLMLTYPSLRVAYIHAALESVDGKYQKVYYSVLVKGGDSFEEEIYRIKLPGPPTDIGEAKAENQNHAIVFTRGEALQKIDTNQDNNFAEAFKLRNALEEFTSSRRKRKPTILGIRDHIFSGSVSSLSWFMSNQENSSATIGQRILANPLRVRFHYGRNDIFDRIFHITRGGVSKASKVINRTMDDVFAGFNSTLRGGIVTHHEYIQMGRWRDVGMNQISLTDAMDASGNGEQTLSRDVHRLGRHFDFYRMLSFYYTTVGFYFSSMVAVMTVYVFLYGRLYVIMSGAEKEILKSATVRKSVALVETLATQFVIQMGLFLTLPMMIEIGLEKAFRTAFGDFVFMQLQLAPAFFTFRMGTKAHHYGNTLLYGSSKLRATVAESSFVVPHTSFAENYRLYSRSHFVKGLELLVLMVVCQAYGDKSDNLFAVISDVSLWLLVASWLFAPFLFNPPRFDWGRTVDEWRDWEGWIENEGVIGIAPDKSWESWWEGEHEYLKYMSVRGKLLVVVLAFRFFVYQYGIVYHLDITHRSKSLLVYGLSWVFTVSTLLVLKIAFTKRNPHKTYNIYKAVMYFGVIAIMADLFVVYGLTITDLLAAILAFLPSGWAFILIGQACRGLAERIGVWESVKELAKAYDFVMGVVIFGPIAALSWFPIVSKLQKRLLFYQAFIRGL